ncbi:MAG TPA: Rrf2 family transcriptional regulator [Chthoniobacterales bacterium]|nr:Rrf2 family transcriptional regulator [Chthoniobacterales bacterium]
MLLKFHMRLGFSTDYALHLSMLVGLETNRLVTIEDVAARFGISKNHLLKVVYQLSQARYP